MSWMSKVSNYTCPQNLILYMATVYGDVRHEVFVEQIPVFIFRKQAALFNISGTPFHYNMGLRLLDKLGALYTHPCLQLRPRSTMQEVLRVGTRYYVRGSHREVQEGGSFGCWFLAQSGSGAFVNTSNLLRTTRNTVFANNRSLFPGLTLQHVQRDALSWCNIAKKLSVSGFIFGREIVLCDCGPKTSLSCISGLKYGWDADADCNCIASNQYLQCAQNKLSKRLI